MMNVQLQSHQLGKAQSVLRHVSRKVGILQKDIANLYISGKHHQNKTIKSITYKPFLCTTNVSRCYTGNAIALRVVGIDRLEGKIPWVDGEGLTTKCQSNASCGGAGQSETPLTIGLSSRNSSVDCVSIRRWRNYQSGAYC